MTQPTPPAYDLGTVQAAIDAAGIGPAPVTAEPAEGSVWDATGMCWHRYDDGWRFTAKGREGSTIVGPATTFDRINRRWGPLYNVEPTKAELEAHWDAWRQEQHREAARLLALLDKRGESR